MNIDKTRWIPIGIVFAVAGYCCWPEGTNKLAEEGTQGIKLVKWEQTAHATTGSSRSLFAPQVSKKVESAPAALEPSAPETPELSQSLIHGRFQLNGVAQTDNQRWAVINGRLHSVGSTLPLDSAGQLNAEIVRIDPDRVLLKVQDELTTLTLHRAIGRGKQKDRTSAVARRPTLNE